MAEQKTKTTEAVENMKKDMGKKLETAKERVENMGFFQKMRQAWADHVAKNKQKGLEAKATRGEEVEETPKVSETPKTPEALNRNEVSGSVAKTLKTPETPVTQNETSSAKEQMSQTAAQQEKVDVSTEALAKADVSTEALAKADVSTEALAKVEEQVGELGKKEGGAIDVSKLSAEEKKELLESEKLYQEGLATIRDLIAPSSIEISTNKMSIGGMWCKSFYVYTYPRYLESNWLAPVVNFDVTMDISMFIYPYESAKIMKVLRNKVAQMRSNMRIAREKGTVEDPAVETALQDAEELRRDLQRGTERFFQFALYFTIYHEDPEKLEKVAKQLESILGGKLVLTKRADLQMEYGFTSTAPLALDELEVTANMNTGPLSTTFPFTSSELTSNEGILYGLNRHNDSLIIFDRFSLENANSVVFAKSGAGKSYAVKLEILRSLMFGTDVLIVDPENEYEALSDTVGGTYIKVSLNSNERINPFDLPLPLDTTEEVKPGDLLRENIIALHGLLRLMLGGITPGEEGILDQAMIDTYGLKGITMETENPSEMEPPTMSDLESVLSGMKGAENLVQRIQKYTKGTFAGIFNQRTNVDLKSGLIVFCIRDLEDELRSTATFIILNYIWNRVRSKLKKRLLIVDEAWSMMQHEDSAKFLYGLAKRARKYYLGISTITQDVEDFVASPYGKPIITNSSMQLLLKQSPAAIDPLAKIFNLTEGEKYMLLNSGVGQGLFFAGNKHVAIQIIASYGEDKIVTTNPSELIKKQETIVTPEASGTQNIAK